MARDFHDPANATDALGIRSGFDREAGERMASLVCLAPRNLRQRFRWRRLGVDCLAPTQARSMGISNEAAKSGHTMALQSRPRSSGQISANDKWRPAGFAVSAA